MPRRMADPVARQAPPSPRPSGRGGRQVRTVLSRLLTEYPVVRAVLVLISKAPRGWDVLREVVDEMARAARVERAQKGGHKISARKRRSEGGRRG